MSKIITWADNFCPSYTPVEMLDQGVFEGLYVAAIPNLPSSWYKHPNVLPRGSDGDVNINRFKVKSRMSLKEWEDKGWTTKDSPLGWFQWYCYYFLGRRIPKEDKLQIGRWNSYVARHQGQIVAAKQLKDLSKRVKQRQGLLQWSWDSTKEFTDANKKSNLARLAKGFPNQVKMDKKRELTLLEW